MFDFLIRGGRIIDGGGGKSYAGDVGVKDGKIIWIGREGDMDCRQLVDASGCCVMPGFIDMHTHSDLNLIMDKRAGGFIAQGVTTEAVGNCGYSAAPLLGEADLSRNVFCYRGTVTAEWKSFAEYLDLLGEGICINVVPLVGHGAVRSSVMGYAKRPALSHERDAMCRLLEDCYDRGAAGFSTGLEYFPGSVADGEEIKALCRVTAGRGRLYATHVRNRDRCFESGFVEAVDTASETEVKLQLSHAVPKYGAPQGSGERVLELVEAASGHVDVGFDVIPYEWGPTAITALLPAGLLAEGAAKTCRLLREPSVREELRMKKDYFWQLVSDGRWEDIILYDCKHSRNFIGMTMGQIASAVGGLPLYALLDIIVAEGEDMYSAVIMGRIKDGADLNAMAGHHLGGVISDAMSLNRDGLLGDIRWSPGCWGWVREFMRRCVCGGLMTLEEAVRKITSYPASRLGLCDRGVISEGMAADIAVIDMERYLQGTGADGSVSGVRCLLINGGLALSEDRPTGLGCGRVLKF